MVGLVIVGPAVQTGENCRAEWFVSFRRQRPGNHGSKGCKLIGREVVEDVADLARVDQVLFNLWEGLFRKMRAMDAGQGEPFFHNDLGIRVAQNTWRKACIRCIGCKSSALEGPGSQRRTRGDKKRTTCKGHENQAFPINGSQFSKQGWSQKEQPSTCC